MRQACSSHASNAVSHVDQADLFADGHGQPVPARRGVVAEGAYR